MAWSQDLRDYLEGPRSQEVWLVEVYSSNAEPGADGYTMSSARGYGDEVLIAAPPRISGPRVTPITWSSTIGTCSVSLSGNLSTAMQHITRGTVCRVLLGRPGMAQVDFDTIFWGQVWSVSGAGVSFTLELRDPLQAIDGRMNSIYPALFYSLATTTVNGAHGSGATTINVASTAGILWDQNGEGIGLIKIGSEYITFTGTTGTSFTGCTRGALGTTAAALTDLEAVAGAIFLKGHPLDIVRRVLLSHPESGNSIWDDYDQSWGIGLRQTLVDIDDIEAWKIDIVKVASGSYTWGVVSEAAVESPASWLQDLLSRAGLFLTTRQGLLTCRGAVSPLVTLGWVPVQDFVITDADVIDGWHGITTEAFASEYAAEYLLVTVTTEGSSSSTAASGDGYQAATLPAVARITYDVSDLVRSNESEVQTEMLNRLALMAQRVPEAIQFTAAGMRLARLAPGDVVYFQSSRAGIRWTYTDGTSGRRCWVAQVSPDWAKNTVGLRLLCYPATSNEFES